jgi:hypothetical protein
MAKNRKRLYYVTPDFANGGDDWSQIATADSPLDAIRAVWPVLDRDGALPPLEQVEDGIPGDDVWTVREFPKFSYLQPLLKSPASGVIGWDTFTITFWKALA